MNKIIAKDLFLSDNYYDHNKLGEYLYQNTDAKQKKILVAQILDLLIETFQLNSLEIVSFKETITKESLWKHASKNFDELRALSLIEQKNNGWPTLNGNIYQLLENMAKIIYNESTSLPKYDYKAAYLIVSNINNISKMIISPEKQKDFSHNALNIFLSFIRN